MSYTEDQIKKYLEILHNYNKKPIEEVNVVIVKIVNVLLLNQVIKFVITVE